MQVIGKFCLVCSLPVTLLLGLGNSHGHAKEYLPAVGPKPLSIEAEAQRLAAVLPSLEEWAGIVRAVSVEDKKALPKSEKKEAETEETADSEAADEPEESPRPDRSEETSDSSSVVEEFQYFTRWDDEILRYFLGVDHMGAGDKEFRVMLPVAFEPPRPAERLRGRATYRQE